MESIRELFKRHLYLITFITIFVFFVCTHLYGIHSPYHQDEYKWVYYSHTEIIPAGTVPHPPLTEFIYTTLGPIVGDNNFRFIPFFFGTLNFFLIFYLAKIIFDKKTAIWVSFLFTISFYSLLASLMVDVDGAVMPFFLLLMFIGYYKLKEINFNIKNNLFWVCLFILGAIGGFLVKVVFAIPIAVLVLDFALDKKTFSDRKKILKLSIFSLIGALSLVLILILSKFIFTSFNLSYSLKYWQHFADFSDRGWFQTFIQFIKAIFYTSPLLSLSLFFGDKDVLKKVRPLLLFLGIEIIFYVFVFDFSTGALDRYFQFVVIPLCVISGAILKKYFDKEDGINKKFIFGAIFLSLAIFLLQFISHYVPHLYPKTEWVTRFISLKWNFLYPFSGGSGPLGFYVSFLFLSTAWIVSVLILGIAFWKSKYKKIALFFIMTLGFVYNGVFIEEYLFGKINGGAPKLLRNAAEFIKNNPEIDKVVVYNDNGGYNIQSINKYQKRLYTAPYFTGQREALNKYKDYYLVIDVPRIDPNSFYIPYLNSCKIIYSETHRKITASVYDCNGVPDVPLN